MGNKLVLAMRVYLVVTFVLLLAYGVGRAFTPFWVDVAFIAWCLLFLIVWSIFSKEKSGTHSDRE